MVDVNNVSANNTGLLGECVQHGSYIPNTEKYNNKNQQTNSLRIAWRMSAERGQLALKPDNNYRFFGQLYITDLYYLPNIRGPDDECTMVTPMYAVRTHFDYLS